MLPAVVVRPGGKSRDVLTKVKEFKYNADLTVDCSAREGCQRQTTQVVSSSSKPVLRRVPQPQDRIHVVRPIGPACTILVLNLWGTPVCAAYAFQAWNAEYAVAQTIVGAGPPDTSTDVLAARTASCTSMLQRRTLM